jgi:peptide/nickel transport system substrate-binding protein
MKDWDQLTKTMSAARMGRREFMGRAAALGVSTALASGVLASGGHAEEPRKGGTLKLGMSGGSTSDSLNPITYTDMVSLNQAWQVMNGLVEITPDMQAKGELLESWEAKPGATEWVFNVRKGVQFHNGKPLDADDILYSINLHRGAASKSPAKPVISGISDIRKVDAHQIAITLSGGNADLPYILSDYHLVVVPNGFADWAKPMGTGGYILQHYEPGVRSTATRNPNYWKPGSAHVEAVEITVINDATARTNALLAGEIHVMNRVDRKTVGLLKQNSRVEVVRSAGGQHYTLLMNCEKGPLADNNIRLALKYAIDRDRILKTILRGYGSLGNDHPIPKTDRFCNKELPQRPYDPDKAKYYLKQAGVDRFKIDLSTSDAAFAGAVDTAVLYQGAATKAGIDINVKREPADGYWDNVWMKAPFCMSYWGGRPTADQMLSIAYKSDAAWNDSAWRRPAFDKLLIEARALLDDDKRRPLYWEMQKMIHDDGGNLIPMFADYIDAASTKVRGFTPSPVFDLAGGRISEVVWLAE